MDNRAIKNNVNDTYTVSHFINGKTSVSGDRQLPIYNPAKGEVIAQVCVANKTVVDEAVAAAKNAFKTWSQTTASQRAKIIFRFKQLLEEHRDELVQIVSREHGKTIG